MDTPDAAGQLSPSQREALEQLVTITDQNEAEATALLQRSNWSVPVAIAKFFDGEPEQVPLEPLPPINFEHPPNPNPRPMGARWDDPILERPINNHSLHELFREAELMSRQNRVPPSERTEVARRVVPPLPAPIWRPPLLIAVLLSPFHLGYRMLLSLWSAVQYVASFIPYFRRPRPTGPATTGTPGLGRRQLSPRDAATRFRRDFEEQYNTKVLEFSEEGYAQVYDQAKERPQFLLVVLLSPEHDDTDKFVRETLLAPEVTEILANPANNFVLWGGNVMYSEALHVANEFKATRFPFCAVVCVTPKEGGISRMGTIKRMVGLMPAASFAGNLRAAMTRCAEDMAAVRAERLDRETTRTLRAEQDDAYERSLAADRERTRQRQMAEAEAAEAERQAVRQAEMLRQWRKWRQAQLAPEPQPGAGSTTGIVRVALKLPESCGGERVRRAFTEESTVEDLYAFADGLMAEREAEEDSDEDDEGDEDEAVPETAPEGYTHEYTFRIVSVLPREVHEPSTDKTLMEAIGRSASLMVEYIEEEEEEEEQEEQEEQAVEN